MRRTPVLVGLLALLIGSFGFFPRSAATQEATPSTCQATTPDENSKIITEFYSAITDRSDISSFLAGEHTVHSPDGEVESSEIADWATAYREDFPDLKITVEMVIAQDDLVAAYTTWSGTTSGGTRQDSDEYWGFPETERAAEWVGSTIFRIECGKVVEVWPVVASLTRLINLGVITPEELQSVEGNATPVP